MRDLWKAAGSFGVDTFALSEKLILQMLYSGAYVGETMDIFRNFCRDGAGSDLEKAFLSQNAYDSFVKDQITESFIFARIGKLAIEGTSLPMVCRLAYLKYYAEHDEEEQPDQETVRSFLREMLDKKMFFPFCTKYIRELPQMKQFTDKTMLEYKTRPGSKCVIHYMLSSDAESRDEYRSEDMREMYDGIFVSAFVLFFGEQLQYYVTEETMAEDEGSTAQGQLTESGTVSKSDINQNNQTGRYDLINDLMIGMTLQDYNTADRLLAEYTRRRFLSGHLFQPRI
jgi:hypothetical protein